MSDLLLDTHALIWWWLEDTNLSASAKAAIELDTNRIFVSAVSIYEIANKERRGRLPALREILAGLNETLAASGFIELSLSSHHALRGGFLRGDHRDPFDRMIAAQGLLEGMTVVTRDRQIATFGCDTLW